MPRFVTKQLIEQVLYSDPEQPHEQARVASSFEELSAHIKRGEHPLHADLRCVEFATVFRNGVDWILELMRLHQPATYGVLAQAGLGLLFAEGILISSGDIRTWTHQAYIQFGDRLVILAPYVLNATMEQEGESHPAFYRYASLPLPIAQAYYARIAGLKISHEFMASLESRGLPAVIDQWAPAHDLVSNKKQAANMTAALRNVCENRSLPHAKLGETFRIVLDTREAGVYEPAGDFLLVDENSRSGRIYHVKDSDFTTLSLVADPVRLFDGYGAHVLAGKADRFAFEPFLVRGEAGLNR